jgi:hypothetical protein
MILPALFFAAAFKSGAGGFAGSIIFCCMIKVALSSADHG